MSNKKNVESKITFRHNVYGASWVEIETSEDLKTEVAVFRLTEEAQASEVLSSLNMELYRGKEFHYPNNIEKNTQRS
jgi:hypothetical protein